MYFSKYGLSSLQGAIYFFNATIIIATTNANIIGRTSINAIVFAILPPYSVTASKAALIVLTGTISTLTFISFERDL